ncbi:hypothetical protein XAP3CFBP6996_016680 [Xanthomonas citri pv. fuscans CFBP 6996]|nr:hypothetical protein XAP3CFBP6996_016680 [Xanthomonas citri pv. fuscans CFBP 6996]QWN16999.1 hypothetical protein DGN02_15210 [Xanthomonas citri]
MATRQACCRPCACRQHPTPGSGDRHRQQCRRAHACGCNAENAHAGKTRLQVVAASLMLATAQACGAL